MVAMTGMLPWSQVGRGIYIPAVEFVGEGSTFCVQLALSLSHILLAQRRAYLSLILLFLLVCVSDPFHVDHACIY